MKLKKLAIFIVSLIAILGCSNSIIPSVTPNIDTREIGQFIDGPLKGLNYETSSGEKGITDKNGAYYYNIDDKITFYLGENQIGAIINGKNVITPLDLCEAVSFDSSSEVKNMIRFFMALDTGDNPFGITLPTGISTNTPDDYDFSALFAKPEVDFLNDAEILIATIIADTYDKSNIPTEAAAKNHFDLSLVLIETIDSSNANDNLFLTVKLPPGKIGSVNISYNIDQLPPGINRYNSGQSKNIDDISSTLSFSERMYKGNWNFTITQLIDDKKMQIGDILSFFHSTGFSPTFPIGYPLSIGTENTVLQSDLSTEGAIISTVHDVTGNIIIPKMMPDGVTDSQDRKSMTNLTIFIKILDSNNAIVGAFNVSPDWSTTGVWNEIDTTYSVPFTTSLPSGYTMTSQIYLSDQNYDLFQFHQFGTALTAPRSDYNFALAEWELIMP